MTARAQMPWGLIAVGGVIVLAGVLYVLRTNFDQDAASGRGGDKAMSTSAQSLIHHADQSTFDETVLRASGPVLVDFYADWCGPCRALAPTLEQLARENPSAKIVKVNVDHSPNLAARYGVSGIPNLVLFRDGQVADQVVGLTSKSRLQSMLTR